MFRYHTASDRGFYKARNELRKLQKERRLAEIGSVSENAQPAPKTVPDASGTAKKAA